MKNFGLAILFVAQKCVSGLIKMNRGSIQSMEKINAEALSKYYNLDLSERIKITLYLFIFLLCLYILTIVIVYLKNKQLYIEALEKEKKS